MTHPDLRESHNGALDNWTTRFGLQWPSETTSLEQIQTLLELIALLQVNKDVFAWEPSNMPGIPREVIEHELGLSASVRPVRQKQRRYTPEKQAAI
jgi:hypothetical protein